MRPKLYNTEEEKRQARIAKQRRYRERLKAKLMEFLSGIEVAEDEPDKPIGTIVVLPKKEDAPESRSKDLTSTAATYRSLTREEALYVGSTMRYIGTLRRKGGWSELELKKMLDDEIVKFREGKRR